MLSRFFVAGLILCGACSRPLASSIAPDTEAAHDAGAPSLPSASPSATAAGETPPAAPAQTASASPIPPAGVTQRDEDALREAVLRHMFKKNASGMQQTAKVFCIHFEKGASPSAAFLARFSANRIRVVAGAGCDEDASRGVIERATGAQGLAFRIDSIAWTDRDHATVDGGYYEAGLSASGNVYTLERKNGAWSVTKDEMRWIS